MPQEPSNTNGYLSGRRRSRRRRDHQHAKLTVVEGPCQGLKVEIRPGQAYVVGRTKTVTVHLPDSEVSRRHALVELRSDALYVTDLASRNGSFVGSRRLKPDAPTKVPKGEHLRFGACVLRVELVGFTKSRMRESQKHLIADAHHLPSEEFLIKGELGSGAMGRVWAAHQKLMARDVAVKVLHAEVKTDSEEYRRFLREAQVFGKVKSPYIVELYDVRVVASRPCLIMELVQGCSAEDRIFDQGVMELPEAVRIGEQIARALDVVASAGIVHRDIKPANIFLGPNHVAKLGDFGISKELAESNPLTEPGVGLGSFPYIAPEQALRGDPANAAGDVFSLGATLYHMISGAPHYVAELGANVMEQLDGLLQVPQLLSHLRPDCPRPVAEQVRAMMSQDPTKRPTAAEVAEDLARLRRELNLVEAGDERSERRKGDTDPALRAVDLEFDDY